MTWPNQTLQRTATSAVRLMTLCNFNPNCPLNASRRWLSLSFGVRPTKTRLHL